MWDKLDESLKDSPKKGLEVLLEVLEESGDPHLLFDAQLLKWRYENDLPLTQPTALNDVPRDRKSEFEKVYIDAARKTGQKLLERGQLVDSWMYFRVIGEPEELSARIEAYEAPAEINDELEEMLQLALFQKVNPSKGVRLMLETHGMCNTVTAVDQIYLDITPSERAKCAEIMVKELYEDLRNTVRMEIEQRTPMLPPDQSLSELLAGRLWLFEDDNYHTDVSHLNAVVRFARSLEKSQEEAIDLAIQLCDYGARLSPHLQYPGEPPFDDYYVAHKHYFQIVADRNREESLQFFQDRMQQAEDDQDRELIAYVLVDLLMRLGKSREAIETAEKYLNNVNEQSGFSFTALCEDTGDMSALQRHARKINNPVLYLASQLSSRG